MKKAFRMNSERPLFFIAEMRLLARPPVVPEAELLEGLQLCD